MREEQQQFLVRFGRPPARLNAEQAAWVLNCQPHDIPVLVGARLLKPLGNPPANGIKFFATADVVELTQDRGWLNKVTATIYAHWHRQNSARKNRGELTPTSQGRATSAGGVALTC
jgi:hypothetical protein